MLEKLGWLSINQLSCEIRLIEAWKALNHENHCLQGLFEKAHTDKGITEVLALTSLRAVSKLKSEKIVTHTQAYNCGIPPLQMSQLQRQNQKHEVPSGTM